jgi:excisionase family DNA binding protein
MELKEFGMPTNVTFETEPLGVNIEEAARLTSLSVYTIRDLERRNLIKSSRCGRRIIIPMEEVNRIVNEGIRTKE